MGQAAPSAHHTDTDPGRRHWNMVDRGSLHLLWCQQWGMQPGLYSKSHSHSWSSLERSLRIPQDSPAPWPCCSSQWWRPTQTNPPRSEQPWRLDQRAAQNTQSNLVHAPPARLHQRKPQCNGGQGDTQRQYQDRNACLSIVQTQRPLVEKNVSIYNDLDLPFWK